MKKGSEFGGPRPDDSIETKGIGGSRFAEIIEYKNVSQSPEALKRMYEICLEKGYIEEGASFEDFHKMVRNTPIFDERGVDVHLTDLIDQELVAESATFGVNEPTYLELLGSEDIMSLRESDDPNFLLLGSRGHYSAVEFLKFVQKINPDGQVDVIDNSLSQRKRMEEKLADVEVNFQVADVKEMPFSDDSQDLIASDFLLRSFKGKGGTLNEINKDNFIKLFEEVFRVLKPGGVYILTDMPEQLRGFGKTTKDFVENIAGLASKAGLELDKSMDCHSFPLRPEVSSAEIDENGNPVYKNLVSHEFFGVGMKFVKPKK